MFAEDLARKVARRLQGDTRISRFEIRVTSAESIHGHNVSVILKSKGDK